MNYTDFDNWPFKTKNMTFVFIGSFVFDGIKNGRTGYIHSHYSPKHILRIEYNSDKCLFVQSPKTNPIRRMEFTHKWSF